MEGVSQVRNIMSSDLVRMLMITRASNYEGVLRCRESFTSLVVVIITVYEKL